MTVLDDPFLTAALKAFIISSMDSCKHTTLICVEEKGEKLRCRQCHLIISRDELGNGCCPECLDVQGTRHFDFEVVTVPDDGMARYRCESCGVVIEWEG